MSRILFEVATLDAGLQHRAERRADTAESRSCVSFHLQTRQARFNLCTADVAKGRRPEPRQDVLVELIAVDLHAAFLQRERRVLVPLRSDKLVERYVDPRLAPLLTSQTHPRLENLERFLLLHGADAPGLFRARTASG